MPQVDTTWRDAFLVDAGQIAGVRVRPLSAWHCHVAQMLGVSFGALEDGRGASRVDLAHAIAICRSVYRPGRAGLPYAGAGLRRRLKVRWLFVDWRKDARDLWRYWESYQRRPAVVRKAGTEGTPLGCPPYFAMALDLSMLVPSVSFAEAMNMPVAQLYLMRAAAVELSGGPVCAWGSAVDGETVESALAAARAAIERHNAKTAKPAEVANG